jgi:porin
VDRHLGAGVIYRGLLEGRDTDTLGAGYSVILFSSELRAITDQTSESAIEVFYKARLREWFAVQPDMQYIVNPNGQSPDALLVGIRCELMF